MNLLDMSATSSIIESYQLSTENLDEEIDFMRLHARLFRQQDGYRLPGDQRGCDHLLETRLLYWHEIGRNMGDSTKLAGGGATWTQKTFPKPSLYPFEKVKFLNQSRPLTVAKVRQGLNVCRDGAVVSKAAWLVPEEDRATFWDWFNEGGVPSRPLETYWRLINNVTLTRRMLFQMRKVDDPTCQHCQQGTETVKHIAVDCGHTKEFWSHVVTYLEEVLGFEMKEEEAEGSQAAQGFPLFRKSIAPKDRSKGRVAKKNTEEDRRKRETERQGEREKREKRRILRIVVCTAVDHLVKARHKLNDTSDAGPTPLPNPGQLVQQVRNTVRRLQRYNSLA